MDKITESIKRSNSNLERNITHLVFKLLSASEETCLLTPDGGFAPEPHCGHSPQTPTIGSRYRARPQTVYSGR